MSANPQATQTSMPEAVHSRPATHRVLIAMVLTAMATGMGWGIRGQYGHESGAMIAGVLGALTLLLTLGRHLSLNSAFRAAALMTVGIGIGGSMTYGQTLGLTHDKELVGNWEALQWGLLGVFIKGGLWIGFGGALLGIGLSGIRYRVSEMVALLLCLILLMFGGIYLLNQPFDPANQVLPPIYFSDNWIFEPDGVLKPRPEVWGGMLTSLLGLLLYARFVRKDKLAWRLGWAGVLAGGIGFSGGQILQASHSWNPELYTEGLLAWSSGFTKHFNWWNMMETTFGAIWGLGLALALALNLHLVRDEAEPSDQSQLGAGPLISVALLCLHIGLLLIAEFSNFSAPYNLLELYIEFGVVMAAIPIIGIIGSRVWAVTIVWIVVLLPIAGKTYRNLCVQGDLAADVGATLFVLLPTLVGITLCYWTLNQSKSNQATKYVAGALLFLSTTFFWLNSALFEFSWPWLEWNGRTPNQVIFAVCWVAISGFAVWQLIQTLRPKFDDVQTS